jgi:hypothetical protein
LSSSFGVIALSLPAGSRSGSASGGWRKLYPGTPRFGKADGDGLLGASRTMLPFADVMHFLPDKLAGLGGWCFSFLLVLVSTSQSFLFRHIRFCALKRELLQVGEGPPWKNPKPEFRGPNKETD